MISDDDCSMQYVDGNPWLSPILEDDIIFHGKATSTVYSVYILTVASIVAMAWQLHVQS